MTMSYQQEFVLAGVAGRAAILNLTARPAEALRSFEQAREILEPLARDAPADLRRQEELSWLLASIAAAQNHLGRRADAFRLHEQVVGIREALVDFSRRGWIRLEGDSVLILDSEPLLRRARRRTA